VPKAFQHCNGKIKQCAAITFLCDLRAIARFHESRIIMTPKKLWRIF
jgi:hypothetical protein